MSDVARHAGVAIGTVSNTLNSPEKVSERTRRKVLGAIAELGFVRNDAARSLAAGSSTTIGLVLADLGNSFFVDIARGVEQVMRRRGFDVLIANTEIDRDREVRNLELFERSRVAGILFAPLDTPLAHSGVLPIRSTPTVLVNFTPIRAPIRPSLSTRSAAAHWPHPTCSSEVRGECCSWAARCSSPRWAIAIAACQPRSTPLRAPSSSCSRPAA